jgi:hypothetical protein
VFSFLPSITGEENIHPFALLHFVTPRLKAITLKTTGSIDCPLSGTSPGLSRIVRDGNLARASRAPPSHGLSRGTRRNPRDKQPRSPFPITSRYYRGKATDPWRYYSRSTVKNRP